MNSSEHLRRTGREYAIYVATNRAIPRVNDGLKHVQRIALWLLRDKTEKIKTVALSGEMAKEKLYVHGDVSANDAIGKLAAPYKNNVMLIKGHGQFGSRVAPIEGIGAPRYTEVSRSKAAEAIMYPDSDIIDMADNYDGSTQEPMFFAPLVPTVLLNGISGIAVGWSTNILPRKLSGLIQATQDALAGRDSLRGLEPFYERYTLDIKAIAQNQYEFSGKVEILDTSSIRVTELPPGHTIESFREKLIVMEEAEAIMSFSDRSTKEIDVTVRFKRGSIREWTPDRAIDFLKLREKKTERIVVLDWSGESIITYDDPATLVRDFVSWRLGWYRKRFETRLAEASAELAYWKILKFLFESGFPEKLGSFADKGEMEGEIKTILGGEIKITKEMMDRVTGLPTYRWTQAFKANVIARIVELTSQKTYYQELLASPERMKAVYSRELDDLKKLKL